MDGITATREIIAAAPGARILILTTFEDDDYVFGALTAGASGFLLKRTQPEQLIAKRILAKLSLRDRVQAVILAYETGLIRPSA